MARSYLRQRLVAARVDKVATRDASHRVEPGNETRPDASTEICLDLSGPASSDKTTLKSIMRMGL